MDSTGGVLPWKAAFIWGSTVLWWSQHIYKGIISIKIRIIKMNITYVQTISGLIMVMRNLWLEPAVGRKSQPTESSLFHLNCMWEIQTTAALGLFFVGQLACQGCKVELFSSNRDHSRKHYLVNITAACQHRLHCCGSRWDRFPPFMTAYCLQTTTSSFDR